MAEVRFYHLERTPEDAAIVQIAAKAYQSGKRVLVRVETQDYAQDLSAKLWAYRPDSFVAHGTAKDGNAEQQPVYIGVGDENPNEAKIYILSALCSHEVMEGFDLRCEMINEDNKQDARERWKGYKEQGYEVSYWQETDRGWVKRA